MGESRSWPVIGHAPAQQRLSPTPPPAVYERLFFYMAVAFHHSPFGGAVKANRWAALSPYSSRRTVTPIVMHRYQSAGKPAIPRAGAGQGRVHPNVRRAWCPSCMVHPNARRAGCPSCGRRVPCMGEFRSWPVVRSESRAWASPGHGPSSAMPRPNMAWSRRRHRRYTNVYSFTPLWRFMVARSAARLRQGVGRR